eukprot:COSAG05_NODE_7681_length_780_cov_0.770925_1_plen_220_part_01
MRPSAAAVPPRDADDGLQPTMTTMPQLCSRQQHRHTSSMCLVATLIVALLPAVTAPPSCPAEIGPGPTTDATLKALTVDKGTLKPAFCGSGRGYHQLYADALPEGTAKVNVVATANSSVASVSINGMAWTGRIGKASILVSAGTTTKVCVTVKAKAGDLTSYNVTLTVPPAPPPSPTYSCNLPPDGKCKMLTDGTGKFKTMAQCVADKSCAKPTPKPPPP